MRPSFDDYFLGIARAVAARADCTRRKVGAVIVSQDHRVISTGYNGAPSKAGSCLEGDCPRGRHYEDIPIGAGSTACDSDLCDCDQVGGRQCSCGDPWPCRLAATPGSSYDTGAGSCIALHAEQNAIIYARESLKDCAIYITHEPCDGCLRLIQGVGITYIMCGHPVV